jgi:hypothetical protein
MELHRNRKSRNMLSQDVINAITLEFKQREWQFLCNLPYEYTRWLVSEVDELYDPSLLTHYGEFFLTLSGIKPCLLITSHSHPTFAEDFYEHVFSHIMEKLEGFELFRVDQHHGSSPSSSPGSSPSTSPSPVNRVVYVFTSRYNAKFPLIREVFMNPNHRGPIPSELLGKALGYPAPSAPHSNGHSKIFSYVDVTSTQELGVDSLSVFEFSARDGFDYSIKMHFEKCATEFRKLGKVLAIESQCC